MNVNEELKKQISAAVLALGYEFIGCEFGSQGRQTLLRIYIDAEPGVTMDDCEKVSRQIGAVLDVEDPFSHHYLLEVSSPGMDRPLFIREHYERFVGKTVRIRLHEPMNGRRNYKGLLLLVDNNHIHVVVDGETYILLLSNIEKANLVPDF